MPRHAPTPARWSALLFSCLVLTGCSLLPRANDADPDGQPGTPLAFEVRVQAPDALRPLLEQHLELQRFRHLPDLRADELERLRDAAAANARELLATQGYFSPDVQVLLTQAPPGSATAQHIRVQVEPGPRTQVAQVDIRLQGPGAQAPGAERLQQGLQSAWTLPSGQPFTQDAWDNAKQQGLRTLQTRRYPAARIAHSRADIDAPQHQARLAVHYDSGPLYRFGALQVQGSERYGSDTVRRIARLPLGSTYDEAALLDAQQRLADSGYFDAVFLSLAPEAQDPLSAPVLAQVREAPLQKWVLGVGASTDSGLRLSVDHTHNRLPWLGWRALSKIGWDRNTQSLTTDWTGLPHDSGWRWFTGALVQRDATGSTMVHSSRLRAGRAKSSQRIDRSLALQYDSADSQGVGAPPSSAALGLHYAWTGRYFNQPTNPTRGWGLAWELGLGHTLRPERDPYVRALVRWLHYQPLGQVGKATKPGPRARIAWRAEGGAVLARDGTPVPVSQLFVTGGDTTVRGYGYHSIGARTTAGQTTGGRYLVVGSMEWQHPLVLDGAPSDWESALFLDAGAVADQPGDLHARVGVGAGLRWRSPVGPVQADLAYGVQERKLRLHLRLGFRF